jgi:hypothetical protein
LTQSTSKYENNPPFVGLPLTFAKVQFDATNFLTFDGSNYLYYVFNQYRIALVQSSTSSDVKFETLIPANYVKANFTAPQVFGSNFEAPLFLPLTGNIKEMYNQAQISFGSKRKPTSPACASLAARGVEMTDIDALLNSWKQMYPDAGLDIKRLSISDTGINAQYTIILFPSLTQPLPFQSVVCIYSKLFDISYKFLIL